MSLACQTTLNLLDGTEESQKSADPTSGVKDVLATMKIVPSMFKVLTNFTIDEFNELSNAVCGIIATHARSTGEMVQGAGRPPKLSTEQRLLKLFLYLKHDNTTLFDAHQCNWAKSSVERDSIFIASCMTTPVKTRFSGLILASAVSWEPSSNMFPEV